jgi:hypothetical protein
VRAACVNYDTSYGAVLSISHHALTSAAAPTPLCIYSVFSFLPFALAESASERGDANERGLAEKTECAEDSRRSHH